MQNTLSFPVPSVLLLGPTGVGKSPLGDVIASRGLFSRKAHHLDFGFELRSIVQQTPCPNSSYSSHDLTFLRGVLHDGLLLENEHFSLARKIIERYLDRTQFCSADLLILNGIPRHTGQARSIASLADIKALIVLDCSPDAVYCRLQKNVGGDRTERTDDRRELVAQKLQIFRTRTSPLLTHYTQKGITIYHIDVTPSSTTDDAYSCLASLTAADPPVSLVAEPPQR